MYMYEPGANESNKVIKPNNWVRKGDTDAVNHSETLTTHGLAGILSLLFQVGVGLSPLVGPPVQLGVPVKKRTWGYSDMPDQVPSPEKNW